MFGNSVTSRNLYVIIHCVSLLGYCSCLKPQTKGSDFARKDSLRQLIKDLKSRIFTQSQKEGESNNLNSLTRESWESIDQPESDHKQLLDNWDEDQESPVADLLESFVILDNGKMYKPLGLKPWKKDVTEAESHDVNPSNSMLKMKYDFVKRNFATNERLWEKGIIPYEIDAKITQSDLIQNIKTGIELMNKYTCLQIKPRSEVQHLVSHKQYINFQSDSTCISFIGRYEYLSSDMQPVGLAYPLCNQVPERYEYLTSDMQPVGMAYPLCNRLQTVLHELMHVAGMHHEQSRQDRDSYISVYYDNIVGGKNNKNVNIQKTDDAFPYDAESVLQYGLYDLAIKQGLKTMALKDKILEFLPAMSRNLSFYDVAEITKAYHCTDWCSDLPVCANGGFVHKGCECLCPKGLKGNLCQDVDTDKDCGGIITLNIGESQVIKSPNFPNKYKTGTRCVWLIKRPTPGQIKMSINEFHVAYNRFRRICYHWVEFRYNLIGQTGVRECGYHQRGSGVNVVTSSDAKGMMLISFDSAFNSEVPATKGFELLVEAL